MAITCILNDYKKSGCSSCSVPCAHRIALVGLNGEGGRIGAARIPKLYRDTTLANSPARHDQARIYADLSDYVQQFAQHFKEGGSRLHSVYLFSNNTGTGKTTTACALLVEYIIQSYISALKNGQQPPLTPGYFLDVNEWQELYNEFNRPNVPIAIAQKASYEYYLQMRKAINADCLVMDDIGVRSSSEAFRGDLHKIINTRLSDNKPTIYTSNISIEQLEQIFDRRVADRVRAMCKEYRFRGNSKRGEFTS